MSMESFFFNITDTPYKIENLFEDEKNRITRVDISNGIVFLDLFFEVDKQVMFHFQNLDRMLCIPVVFDGRVKLYDTKTKKEYIFEKNSVDILLSSRQDIIIEIEAKEKTELFVLCIADFILKRYLTNRASVVDYFYDSLQKELSLLRVDSYALDAMSFYIIDKIKAMTTKTSMNSLRCEHAILEFMIHRFSLVDINEESLSDDEICITRSAKDILLKSFVDPPTIEVLAHLCATNETKLKHSFKKRYKTTIHNYIQKLRLQKANLLLREQNCTIGEIANKVGYKHQGHFSKLFFSFYGVYPKDLLKK